MMTTMTTMNTMDTYQMVRTAISLVLGLLTVAGTWQIFVKMGEKGWKALIPVYSSYLLFKKTWNKKMFAVSLVLSVIGLTSLTVLYATILTDVDMDITVAAFAVTVAAVLIKFVLRLVFNNKLSRSFGHGIGYTLGLSVLPGIFYPIVGFGKSQFANAQ